MGRGVRGTLEMEKGREAKKMKLKIFVGVESFTSPTNQLLKNDNHFLRYCPQT